MNTQKEKNLENRIKDLELFVAKTARQIAHNSFCDDNCLACEAEKLLLKRIIEPTNCPYLQIDAGVRYWEDATVNGEKDINGDKIPFRKDERWVPIIDIDSGAICNWPFGICADIHYKICDDGNYHLLDKDKSAQYKLNHDYVPDFLDTSKNGYGDYIILKIDINGQIKNWRKIEIDLWEWERIN